MKLYQLMWRLLVHALHGRFRDEVFISVSPKQGIGWITGTVTDFTWVGDDDAFCVIEAVLDDEFKDVLS